MIQLSKLFIDIFKKQNLLQRFTIFELSGSWKKVVFLYVAERSRKSLFLQLKHYFIHKMFKFFNKMYNKGVWSLPVFTVSFYIVHMWALSLLVTVCCQVFSNSWLTGFMVCVIPVESPPTGLNGLGWERYGTRALDCAVISHSVSAQSGDDLTGKQCSFAL